MTRTFTHKFHPSTMSPISGADAELTVQQIEHAGIKEVLQSGGANLASWSIMESLLQPSVLEFRFREPLGIAREVKVALSGLFGRFVARAYLERYMDLTYFGHIGTKRLTLDGHNRIDVARKPGQSGDLPDWIACSDKFSNITIAEAKGCHSPQGPSASLKRAWAQARRVNVLSHGRRLPVKRIAVVTRWASVSGGSKEPIIAVRDPEEPGDPDVDDMREDACIGVARMHLANLLEPLGFGGLAEGLRLMCSGGRQETLSMQKEGLSIARRAFASIRPRRITRDGAPEISDAELVGSYVARVGPIGIESLSRSAAQQLRDLQMRPMFVGVNRAVLDAVIHRRVDLVRAALQEQTPEGDSISTDRGGVWVVELDGSTEIS